jgi:hypothetical protein
MFKKGNTPWNLGKTGTAAGWTASRRERISLAMTGHRGPRPHVWHRPNIWDRHGPLIGYSTENYWAR